MSSSARPVFVDVDTAISVIPGMTKQTILHAGPPVTWEKMAGPMRGAVIGALIYEGMAQRFNPVDGHGREEGCAIDTIKKTVLNISIPGYPMIRCNVLLIAK